MAEDITTNFKNHVNRTTHNEHDRLNNKAMSSKKITKECVDRLIEDIDKTLKAPE
ncbi:hypothetical protein [Lysinibacillus sp. NPDC086135]|uniref:hypothetical protein n=1 Tax=Lysinibacillus sp. NPDC086135 TaxID=3364130 RepID=UPI0038028CFD